MRNSQEMPEGLRTRARNAWLMLRHGSQWWYWTAEWQAGEREADADIAAGRTETYEDVDEFLASFRIDPADQHPRDCAYPLGVCTCPAHNGHPSNQSSSWCLACILDGEMAILRMADKYRERWGHRV